MGVDLRKKTKDLSAHESDERGHGKDGGVYTTLSQSDTVQSNGLAKSGTRPVGDGLRKKPKGVSTEDVRESTLWYDVVCSRKVTRHL